MSYLSTVLADAPAHYWRMADGGGEICHDIGSASKHAICFPEQLGYTSPTANGGAAISGTTGHGIVTEDALPLLSPLSVELLFWPLGTPGTAQVIIAWDNSAAPSFLMQWLTTSKVSALFSGSATVTSGVLTTQLWHHLVFTYDEVTMRLYLDGVLQPTAANATHYNTSHLIGIGENPIGGSSVLAAVLSEVALYTTVLSPARVTAHYLAIESLTSTPTYGGPGQVLSTGIFTSITDLSAAVLAAVKKTFPTT